MFIEDGQIDRIRADLEQFKTFFSDYAIGVFKEARLYPRLSLLRLVDIHGAWVNDISRVGTHEPNLGAGLDHFKLSGHLAFWIRRFSPIVEAIDTIQDLGDAEGYAISIDEVEFRELLFSYANEYIAFDVGFQFCRFYETKKSGGSARASTVLPDGEYIDMVCHFMKYKTVSPHAIMLMYKSLFHG